MNKIQKTIGTTALAAMFAVMPLMASADTVKANAGAGVFVSPSGIIRVFGADVTAVSNGVVNAGLTIGNVLMNWVVNLSADTKIAANGSKTATSSDIKVGDKIAFAGTASTSTGSSVFTVAAKRVRDLTSMPLRHIDGGTISSISLTVGSFVITHGDKNVTVQTNASTTITLNGVASALGSLAIGEKVAVAGVANADGSIITASKVVARTPEVKKPEPVKHDEATSTKQDEHKDNSDKKDIRAGIRFLGGLHLGFGNGDK